MSALDQKISQSLSAYLSGWLVSSVGTLPDDKTTLALAKSNPKEYCVGVLHGKKSITPIMSDDVLSRVIEDITNKQAYMRGEL